MTYRKIMVPVDGSATSNLGLREGIRLAKEQGASILLVHVVDQHYVVTSGMEAGMFVDDLFDSLRAAGRDIIKKAEAVVKKQGLAVKSVMLETLTGPAADGIVREAKRARADVIVIGTHGRRGVRRLLMGSDAEQVVRLSPVPVLLIRGRESAAKSKRR